MEKFLKNKDGSTNGDVYNLGKRLVIAAVGKANLPGQCAYNHSWMTRNDAVQEKSLPEKKRDCPRNYSIPEYCLVSILPMTKSSG